MTDDAFDIRILDEEAIRKYKAMELVWEVFSEFEAPDYSDEGVAEFKRYLALDGIFALMRADELRLWGCFDRERIVGLIAIKFTNHISLLFVHRDYHRRNIARKLYDEALQYVLAQGDRDTITVNSSPYAVEAYRHLGFEETGGECVVNGLRFISMGHALKNH